MDTQTPAIIVRLDIFNPMRADFLPEADRSNPRGRQRSHSANRRMDFGSGKHSRYRLFLIWLMAFFSSRDT